MSPPVGGEGFRRPLRHATVGVDLKARRKPSASALTPHRKESQHMATTATPQSIEQTIVDSLVNFGADAGAVNRDATLEAIDIDSLDLVELTQVVEETYDIDLEDSDLKNIKTVGDVVDLVVAKVG
jgi:acyl carrier protein